MCRCLAPLALVVWLLTTPPAALADGQGLCLVGNGSARLLHQVLGEEAIASPEHYPLGAMILRPMGDVSPNAVGSPSPVQALVRVQLLSYGDACARRVTEALAFGGAAYIRLPLALDYVSRQRAHTGDARLQDGDILYLPPHTSSVMVVGSVSAPGAVDFQVGADARDYIQAAGGWSSGADRSGSFVYLPDGQRRQLSATFWNYQRRNVPPGSVVVVPGRGVDLEKQSETLRSARAASHAKNAQIIPMLRLDSDLRSARPESDAPRQ